MLARRNADEIPRQLQKHPLLGCRLERLLTTVQALEEVADVDTERLRNIVQAAGGDPVDPLLVLVRLLVGHPDQLGHLLLGQSEHDPALANAQADIPVDVQSTAPAANVAA